MDDLSCILVVRKKYANIYDKDSSYTNSIDITIIWLYCRLYSRLFCRLFFVKAYGFVQQAYGLGQHVQDAFLVLLIFFLPVLFFI